MSKFRLFASAAGLLTGAVLAVPASAAAANGVSISVDEVRVITFATAVKTVYVGNPTIADITVIDPRHVFLLGKSYGTTNMLALDSTGRQVAEEKVSVLGHQESVVTLQRGTARTTLNCMAQRCEVSPTPGDDSGPFDAVSGQIDKHQGQNQKSASTQ